METTYENEQIIDTTDRTIYKNFKELKKAKKLKNDDIYEICGIYGNSCPYHFINEDNLEYCWGDGTKPEHASIGDIRSGRAKAYVCVPTFR